MSGLFPVDRLFVLERTLPVQRADCRPVRRLAALLAPVCLTLASSTSLAAPPVENPPEPAPLARVLNAESRTLDNGLRLLLAPDGELPTVTSCATFKLGFGHEQPKARGTLAALLRLTTDPLLNQVAQFVTGRAGTISHDAGADLSSMCVTAPAHELGLTLWALAEWMKPLRLSQARLDRALEPEGDAQPPETTLLGARRRLKSLVFRGYAPYDVGPVEGLAPEDVEQLHAAGFQPRAAVISVAGQLEEGAAVQLANQYLGAVPPRGAPPELASAEVPLQTTDRFLFFHDASAEQPSAFYGWSIPEAASEDHRALKLAAIVLAGGEGSRLHQELVHKRHLLQEVHPFIEADRKTALLGVRVVAKPRVPLSSVHKIIIEQLRRFRGGGPTAVELDRARERLGAELVFELQSTRERARWLGERAARGQPLDGAEAWTDAYATITAEAVRRAAGQHLTELRVSVVEAHPPGYQRYAGSGGAAVARVHIVDQGETLIGIAKRYGVSVAALTSTNRIDKNKPIFPGQKLKLPSGAKAPKKPRVHVVKAGDTLIGIAKRYGVTVADITGANGISRKKPIRVGQKLVVPPKKK